MKKIDDSKTTVFGSPTKSTNTKAGNLFDDVPPKAGTAAQGGGTTTFYGSEGSISGKPSAGETVIVNPHNYPQEEASFKDFMGNPVVGWIVVIRGAGKGVSLPLGYGANSIGRAASQRVRLDFGDAQISRESHAILTYEPRGRLFYLQNGGGVNLTYLGAGENGAPVLTPLVLESGQCIQLGSTTLKFIALCGSDFDWNTLGE